MLDSIWQLLANYGLDVQEIADGIKSLIVTDDSGAIIGGLLEPMKNFPIIGSLLAAFGDFAPDNITTAATTVAESVSETIA